MLNYIFGKNNSVLLNYIDSKFSELETKVDLISRETEFAGRILQLEDELRLQKIENQQLQDALTNGGIPPVPPRHLQERVVGGYSPAFMGSATQTVTEFEITLAENSHPLERGFKILDFGVGCGRVIRRFAELHPQLHFVGADIDAEAIGWLSQNYSPRYGAFVTLPHRPQSSLKTGQFDMVYSISVFTHLDEQMQFKWLEELQRVTKPGAILLLTVHGENHYKAFPQEAQEIISNYGFYFHGAAASTDGLPEFYRSTAHSRTYVEREWAKYFDIVNYKPLGSEGRQDIVVCRRRQK
jgi:ubiquinone/menaquinone biosynthesis C-methylase UbiE